MSYKRPNVKELQSSGYLDLVVQENITRNDIRKVLSDLRFETGRDHDSSEMKIICDRVNAEVKERLKAEEILSERRKRRKRIAAITTFCRQQGFERGPCVRLFAETKQEEMKGVHSKIRNEYWDDFKEFVKQGHPNFKPYYKAKHKNSRESTLYDPYDMHNESHNTDWRHKYF